jgi:hypothetical protein
LCSTALWSIKPFGAFVAHCWQDIWIFEKVKLIY